MDSQLEKVAAQTIRSLYAETEKLAAEVAHQDEVRQLTFDLIKSGVIDTDDLESVFTKLASKSKGDLDVFKKALELSNDTSKFFKVSSKFGADDSMDPLTRMLLEDL